MAKNIDEYFEKLISELEQINHINPKDLPEIELYMEEYIRNNVKEEDFGER